MAEWWEMDEEVLAKNKGAQAEKQLAYYNTFYVTELGRQVLLSLQRECFAVRENPHAMLALIALYEGIRADCGVNAFVEMQAIKAEAQYINLDSKETEDAC